MTRLSTVGLLFFGLCTPLSIRADAGAVLEVRMTDAKGDNVSQCTVEVHHKKRKIVSEPVTRKSGTDTTVRFDGLVPSNGYRVSATCKGGELLGELRGELRDVRVNPIEINSIELFVTHQNVRSKLDPAETDKIFKRSTNYLERVAETGKFRTKKLARASVFLSEYTGHQSRGAVWGYGVWSVSKKHLRADLEKWNEYHSIEIAKRNSSGSATAVAAAIASTAAPVAAQNPPD